MLNEARRHKWLIAAIVAAWIWIILFPLWIDYLKRLPLDEPFSVTGAQNIERIINIPRRHSYHLALQGYVEPSDIRRSELRGKALSIGIDWSIESTDGRTSYNGKAEQVGTVSLRSNQAAMSISDVNLYPRGEYRFSAHLSKPAWELSDIDWHIVLLPQGGKIVQDWRDHIAWVGLLLFPLIRTGIIILSVYLVWEIVRTKLRRS
jgi:hypothetical protein